MTYSALTTPVIGEMFTEAEYEKVRGNFAAGLPGIFTAAQQIAAGTGSQAMTTRTVSTNGHVLIVDTSRTNKISFSGGSVPIGMVIMWSGSIVSIPSGWHLCDGTDGTVDLRNRFVVGAGSSYAVGATGAGDTEVSHSHTYSQTTNSSGVAHTHTRSIYAGGNHRHEVGPLPVWSTSGSYYTTATPPTIAVASLNHTHTLPTYSEYTASHSHAAITTDSTTAAHTHTTATAATAAPSFSAPYYALAYIQRIS